MNIYRGSSPNAVSSNAEFAPTRFWIHDEEFRVTLFLAVRHIKKEADLVNGIAYSSGLGGRTESCFSVLDSEQQGLSAHGLKVVLSLIVQLPQKREV